MTSSYKYCQFLGKAGASVNCKTQNYRMYLLYDARKKLFMVLKLTIKKPELQRNQNEVIVLSC